jgi:superfamily II DNA or RNA helicase
MEQEIKLLPHNEKALEKLNKHLETHQFVSINHATGTGKSFIILKYLSQNRNKRILYLAPTYPIIEQLLNEHISELGMEKNYFPKMDTCIYSNLLKMDMKQLAANYDIIILDEYHRCGATKWGKKINQLLNTVKEKYSNTKVIGTTATEIRYLDRERNMCDILFDSECASKLSLADAILQGILPVPVYINSLYNLNQKLDLIENRINKMVLYPSDRINYFNKINVLRKKLEDQLIKVKQTSNIPQNIKGKYLVFSSTIDGIDDDKNDLKRFFKWTPDKEYLVYYKNKKNQEELNQFRKDSKDLLSVLYSINILNEGVHVKDVDAVVMLRKTTSPIIYFQQLGRLLSYSQRKSQVFVYDLVNNIEQHRAIYKLYSEVISRARELIKTDPINKERYNYIISNFRIMDFTSEICSEIDDLIDKTTHDNLIKQRLNTAINILKNNDNKILSSQAILDIFKYQQYLTLEQFIDVKKLNICKPDIFDLSIEDFKNKLGESANLKEKEFFKANSIFSKVLAFYNFQNRLPSIFSKDIDENKLAIDLMENYDDFKISMSNTIKRYIDDDLSFLEQIAYGLILKFDKKIYNEIDTALDSGIELNSNIRYYLFSLNTKESKSYLNLINEKQKNDVIDFEIEIFSNKEREKLETKYGIKTDLLFNVEFFEYLQKLNEDFEKSNNKQEYINNIYQKIISFIQTNNHLPLHKAEKNSENDKQENELFYQRIIFKDYLKEYGYDKEIDRLLLISQVENKNQKKALFLKEFIDFINNNKGGMPIANFNEYETRLLSNFNYYYPLLSEEEKEWISLTQKKFIKEKYEAIRDYIEFINVNSRRPFINTNNEKEKSIIINYIRFKKLLTPEEVKQIKNVERNISKYKESMILYNQMLEEKHRR